MQTKRTNQTGGFRIEETDVLFKLIHSIDKKQKSTYNSTASMISD